MRKSVAECQRALLQLANTIKDDQGSRIMVDQGPGIKDQEIKVSGQAFRDIIHLVNAHPLFIRVQREWNWYPQAQTNAVKQFGAQVVLDAICLTLQYRAARNPRAFCLKKCQDLKNQG